MDNSAKQNFINQIKELRKEVDGINKQIRNLQSKRDYRKNKIKLLLEVSYNQLELELD